MAQSVTTDQRIDAYIAKTAPFAQPILQHLRRLVHSALTGVEETIKWSMPHFMLRGKNVAGMAAFKAHCAFTIHVRGGTARRATMPRQAWAANPAVQAKFDVFAPSHRREHNEWIGEAKQVATRARRVAQSIMWIAEGKKRNWNYENC